MAHKKKYRGRWYVFYKNEADQWRKKSCGKNANSFDADYLVKHYTAIELNQHHKAPVRIIVTDLKSSMLKFRDEELPRSVLGIDKQQSSIKKEKSSFNNFINFCIEKGLKRFIAFNKDSIQSFLDHRQMLGRSVSTRKEELRLIKKFIKWARKKSFFIDDPAADIIIPKNKNKHPRFFSEIELRCIFVEAREPYRTIFIFLYLTGLRSGELTNLEWRDYNEKTRLLTIRVVEADKKKRQPGNKCKRETTIPISEPAHKILMERNASGESDIHIFLNHAGNRLDDENIYRNLVPILKKCKIRGATVHTFRHTFASHLVIAGVSIYKVRDLLRHASVRETEIYSHLSKESTQAATDIIGQKMEMEINNKQVEEEL